jgi:hypothetical protein
MDGTPGGTAPGLHVALKKELWIVKEDNVRTISGWGRGWGYAFLLY